MTKKLYVKETTYRNSDGDLMTEVTTHESAVKGYGYVLWVNE